MGTGVQQDALFHSSRDTDLALQIGAIADQMTRQD